MTPTPSPAQGSCTGPSALPDDTPDPPRRPAALPSGSRAPGRSGLPRLPVAGLDALVDSLAGVTGCPVHVEDAAGHCVAGGPVPGPRVAATLLPIRASDTIIGTLRLDADQAPAPAVKALARALADQIGALAAAQAEADRLRDDRAAAVEAAESRLTRIALQIPGVVYQYRLDPDGRSCFPYASAGIADIYGVTPEAVRTDATPVFRVLHPDDAAAVAESIQESAATGTLWHARYRVNHPVRGTRWVEGRSQPERLPDGAILWHGIIVDVTDRVQQEETLRAIQDRYRTISVALRDGTFDANLRTGNLDLDDRCVEMLGHRPGAFVVTTATWWDHLHPDDRGPARQSFAAQVSAGDTFVLQVRRCRTDETVTWLEVRGRVVERAGRRPVRLVGAIADISVRKRIEAALQDSEARFRALFEHSPVAYVALDEMGRILEVNETFVDLLGCDAGPLIGQVFQAYLSPAERSTGAHTLATLLHGASDGGELVLLRPDGARVTVQLSGRIERDAAGRYCRLHCVLHDVSAHAQLEARLARSNADLSQFAYAVSHDLREPLRMVRAFLGLIDRRLPDREADPDLREFMGFAQDGARRMDAMILDLLEYSRLQQSDHPPEPVALGPIVTEALGNLAATIAERSAEVSVPETLPTITADRAQMVRLFQNLIGNAIKFVPPDRSPRIVLKVHDAGDGSWRIAVCDNGPGIPADRREQVFGVFQRLVPTGSSDGTGVGLALCRRIVERHQGHIWIEDAPGGGTAMMISLPKQQRGTGDGAGDTVSDPYALLRGLNTHQMRIVARLQNLSDTLRHRATTLETVRGEAEFLVQEVETYRVFVHEHADAIFGFGLSTNDEDPRADADSLLFSVRRWHQSLDADDIWSATGHQAVTSTLTSLLNHVQRTHTRLHQSRAARLAR